MWAYQSGGCASLSRCRLVSGAMAFMTPLVRHSSADNEIRFVSRPTSLGNLSNLHPEILSSCSEKNPQQVVMAWKRPASHLASAFHSRNRHRHRYCSTVPVRQDWSADSEPAANTTPLMAVLTPRPHCKCFKVHGKCLAHMAGLRAAHLGLLLFELMVCAIQAHHFDHVGCCCKEWRGRLAP